MSKIKSTSIASGSPINAEKELPSFKQPAEAKTGEVLLQEVSRTLAKRQEKVRSSHTDAQQKQPKDTAEISETRKRFPTDRNVSAEEALRWILELEEKDWEAFLKWQPDLDLDLAKQLQELSKLYLTLLEAALKYAEGENLVEQLKRLDVLLAQKLSLVMEQNLEQLTTLLEETGQTTTLDSIRSSLYRQTAGKTISPQTAHTLFVHGRPPGSKSTGLAREGMVYQSSGKENIRFQKAYHTQQNSWKEQLRQRNEVISNAKKGIEENTFKQGSSISCSGKELERANRFAAHIGGSGNLLKNTNIHTGNAEVSGLLAAVMSIKGQVYAAESRQSNSITFALENAIDKIIDQYLGQRGASKVYYHTLGIYKQTQNPQKAIQYGQNYAYQQFQEKQKDPTNQKSPQYSKDSVFFRAFSKGLSPEREFALGVNILQKDWQNFLYAIGNRQSSSYVSRIDAYSPWRLLVNIGSRLTDRNETIGKVLLGAGIILIIGALAVTCFRLI